MRDDVKAVTDELYDHSGWRSCTAQGARDQVLLLGMKSSFREKLQKLEEGQRVIALFRKGADSSPKRKTTPAT
ncbi:MAG: hypothetical protein BWK80_61530 [Desulfobacteraceae bacterium IS3]|nr:MAG: hypothetical protein BWK80_61530 [Desulfobacteraceae bacterium IS3]